MLAEGVGYSSVHGQMSGKNFVNLKTSFSGSVVCVVVCFLFVLGRVILITLRFCKVCWPRQAQMNIDLRFARFLKISSLSTSSILLTEVSKTFLCSAR